MQQLLKSFSKSALFFLVIIIVFFVINNLIWLSFDNSPPAWDQSHHMLLSLKYFRLIFCGHNFLSILNEFFRVEHYYPPFFHVSALPIVLLLGFSEHHLIFVNFFYLVLFVVSMYELGKILFNERIGVLAAGLTLFYPVMYALSREYLIDFALVAMVTSTQYLIIKSEGGIKKPYNFVLGIIAGFALLTKPVSVVFFLPSWAFVFFRNSRSRKDHFSLFIVLIISLLISIPWYLSSCQDLIRLNSYFQNHARIHLHMPTKFIPSLLWYVKVLKYSLISPILLIFFEIGLALFLIFDRRWKVFIHLMMWGVPAFFILVFTPNKNERYIMPILPIFALFTIGGIYAVKNKILSNILYCAIFTTAIIQFYNFSFGTHRLLTRIDNYDSHPPLQENWRIQEIINYTSNYIGNKEITIGILSNLEHFNPRNFILYVELLKLPYTIKTLGDSPITNEELRKCDILILNTPPVSVEWDIFFRNKFYEEFNKNGAKNFGFAIIKEFVLPNGSKAIMFKNINKG